LTLFGQSPHKIFNFWFIPGSRRVTICRFGGDFVGATDAALGDVEELQPVISSTTAPSNSAVLTLGP
jgi:hypothetical protein